MARGRTATKSVAPDVNRATVAKATVANEQKEEYTDSKRATKDTKILDSEEIAVESLIPNVSYEDERSGDFYEWEEIGHVEYLTFETLKNMWRNHKGYFKSMILRPNDERVIKHFGLKNTYETYEFLMDASNYTKDSIDVICEKLNATPSNVKVTIFTRIKRMVNDGDISNLLVVRTLEKTFNLDLVSSL